MVLGGRSYRFIPKDKQDEVSGVTLLAIDGKKLEPSSERLGLVFTEPSFKTNDPSRFMRLLGDLPRWFILEYSDDSDRRSSRLLNVYDLESLGVSKDLRDLVNSLL